MSIYCTTVDFDGYHEPGCPGDNKRRTRKGVIISGRCTCGSEAPIVYQGSHILPSEDDPRDGCFDLGSIPGWITRDGRDDGPEGDDRLWPYLRVATSTDDRHTVVLDYRQVQQVHAYLGEWLKRAGEPS